MSFFAPPITQRFGFPKCSSGRRALILLARALQLRCVTFEPNKEYR